MFNEWEAKLQELLMRGMDGEVSDEDVAFVLELLTGANDDPKEWLQSLVDKIGPENMRRIYGLWMIFW